MDVKKIARWLGVKIKGEPHPTDLSGFLFTDGSQPIIGFNSRHSKRRQRFTIAHEIGHLLLHSFKGVHMDVAVQPRFRNSLSSEGTNPEEIEANIFAAELLMPADAIEEDMKRFSGVDIVDDEVITEMARTYDVSVQALAIRLKSLGYIDD